MSGFLSGDRIIELESELAERQQQQTEDENEILGLAKQVEDSMSKLNQITGDCQEHVATIAELEAKVRISAPAPQIVLCRLTTRATRRVVDRLVRCWVLGCTFAVC